MDSQNRANQGLYMTEIFQSLSKNIKYDEVKQGSMCMAKTMCLYNQYRQQDNLI